MRKAASVMRGKSWRRRLGSGEPFDDSPALWLLSRRGRIRELARQVIGALRGKGHKWEMRGAHFVKCPRCGSSVTITGSMKGSRDSGPVFQDFSKMRLLFPECLSAMVYAVHDL